MSEHLPDEQLNALLDGEMAPAARTPLDDHLHACDSCRRELARLAELDRELRAGLSPLCRSSAELVREALRNAGRKAPEGPRGLAPGKR
ncbi:MAG: anti-sigma factor family protein, partial [Planctomycetota bacterium]